MTTGHEAYTLDHETRAIGSDHQALRLWLRLLTCTNLISTQLRSQLRENFNCTLPRFDLLAQLERHPDGLKMGELSRRLMVTGGNITGLTDQLEKEGWVAREEDPDDRRSLRVKLTPSGRERFNDMAQTHEQWVVHLLGQHLSSVETEQLYELLGKLKQPLIETKA